MTLTHTPWADPTDATGLLETPAMTTPPSLAVRSNSVVAGKKARRRRRAVPAMRVAAARMGATIHAADMFE